MKMLVGYLLDLERAIKYTVQCVNERREARKRAKYRPSEEWAYPALEYVTHGKHKK